MKKLFVGCRVRLVGAWLGYGPSPTGREGRICDRGSFGFVTGLPYEWAVDVPGWDEIQANSDDLEPIEPPHESSELSFTELMDRCKAGEVECV